MEYTKLPLKITKLLRLELEPWYHFPGHFWPITPLSTVNLYLQCAQHFTSPWHGQQWESPQETRVEHGVNDALKARSQQRCLWLNKGKHGNGLSEGEKNAATESQCSYPVKQECMLVDFNAMLLWMEWHIMYRLSLCYAKTKMCLWPEAAGLCLFFLEKDVSNPHLFLFERFGLKN